MATSVSPAVSAALSPMVPSDISAAIGLHARLLPHGFFVDLGPGFMSRYYRHFMASPHAYAVVATVNGVVVGALVGTLDHGRHARWTTLRVPGFAASACAAMLRRPRTIRRFVTKRLTRYTRSMARRLGQMFPAGQRRSAALPDERVAVLSHVFMDPDCQGMGLGRALVDSFVAAARAAGASRAELATLHGAAGAGEFYTAQGWERRGRPHAVDDRLFQTYSLTL